MVAYAICGVRHLSYGTSAATGQHYNLQSTTPSLFNSPSLYNRTVIPVMPSARCRQASLTIASPYPIPFRSLYYRVHGVRELQGQTTQHKAVVHLFLTHLQSFALPFSYLSLPLPPTLSALQIQAYRARSELLGAREDPAGWKLVSTVESLSRLFDAKEVKLRLSVSLSICLGRNADDMHTHQMTQLYLANPVSPLAIFLAYVTNMSVDS